MQITWFVVLSCSDTKSVYGWLQPLYRLPKEQHVLCCLEEAVKMGSLQGLSLSRQFLENRLTMQFCFCKKRVYHCQFTTITCPCTACWHSILWQNSLDHFLKVEGLQNSDPCEGQWRISQVRVHQSTRFSGKQKWIHVGGRKYRATNSCLELFWVWFIFIYKYAWLQRLLLQSVLDKTAGGGKTLRHKLISDYTDRWATKLR